MVLKNFRRNYKTALKQSPYVIYKEYRDDTGVHPRKYSDVECEFATQHIAKVQPSNILDVGSYRKYILGLLANYKVDTVDVRKVQSEKIANENQIQSDAKKLSLENKYDVVLSLSSLEHFGLGRYGDEFDLKADEKAIANIIKALKPGGYFIFTTTIRRGLPELCFNAHRTYNIQLLHNFCSPLELVEEKFYSRENQKMCDVKSVTQTSRKWDVYMGCWRKKKC